MSNILLLGDTQTAFFPKNLIGNEEDKIINLGIKNISIENYHKFISQKVYKNINSINYILLQIGLSDIIKGLKEKQKIKVNELIKKIKIVLFELNKFDCKLLVQPIYPTKNKQVNDIIEEFNFLLAQECYQSAIEFLDIYELLLDDNNLLKDLYSNGNVKLNSNGYNLIVNQINDYFESIENNYKI